MKKNKTIIVSFVLLSMMALLVPMAFAPKPIVQQVTGGGWILDCAGHKCTFGFNAEQLEDLETGPLRGNVEYVDHDTGYPHVHGYDITALTIIGDEAWIEGICRLNGDNTERAFSVYVRDEAEPGKHDWFEIHIPSISYNAYAELGFPDEAGGGGNIQIHIPPLP
jgi:hypothetical protein